MQNIIAIELKTTGSDPYEDTIIAVAAAISQPDGSVTYFGELTRPTPLFDSNAPSVQISDTISHNYGITNKMLSTARGIDEVLEELLSFIPENATCISHNADLVKSFLQTATHDKFLLPIIDSRQLAGICFSNLPNHTTDIILNSFNIARSPQQWSKADCEDTLNVWHCIMKEIATWPEVLLIEINHLLAIQRGLPLARFFREISSPNWQQNKSSLLVGRDLPKEPAELIDLFPAVCRNSMPYRELPEEDEWQHIDIEHIKDTLGPNGAFSQNLNGYEHREQQVAMSESIANAFNNSMHLMAEAGTGIGKSLAYLIPAISWATTNNTPVIVSTNTKNLQSQLFKKDIPLIKKTLNIDFKAAIIKGRRNYLCHRKLFYLLNNSDSELNPNEQEAMVRVLAWSTRTKDGDMSDSSIMEDPSSKSLAAQLSSTADECPGGNCPHRSRCFLYFAREQSLAADIVVANHSIVFSEMDSNDKGVILPRHAHIIFDEAHNIEDAATSWLSVETSQTRIRFILRRLIRQAHRNKWRGLLTNLQKAIAEHDAKLDQKLCAEVDNLAMQAIKGIKNAKTDIELFYQNLSSSFLPNDSNYSFRLRPEAKSLPTWEKVQETQKEMLAKLANITHSLKSIIELIDSDDLILSHKADFIQDINASITALREFCDDTAFIMDASAKGYVFWIERASPQQGGARALAAPINIGERLAQELYSKRRSIIFTSATMTVRGSCNFLKKRLGLDLLPAERLSELNVGTVFDYNNQCVVLVPSFLPEPDSREQDYVTEVAELLSEVFRRTDGRALTLFTSYAMLRKTNRIIGELLAGTGVQVLAQGESGSRENITELFKQDIASVLMGTHSFWEGVDMVGETLSCLVMARLPFAVFTDPIIEARCEQIEEEGGNAFMHYSVPNAVIKFRQGFGRLIRHRSDRGIVIITDRRIISKRYGDWFRRSLPVRTTAMPDKDEFLDTITRFLDEEIQS